MIHLSQGEKILMILHKHWIALLGKFVAVIFFALAIPALFVYVQNLFELDLGYLGQFELFSLAIYLMVITLLFFIFWNDYYLDMWIVTSERIIDINQLGLFKREITEFRLDKVQDITIEIPNITATFLKYGNLVLETAGESTFTIKQIPNIHEAKNLILDLTSSHKENVRA